MDVLVHLVTIWRMRRSFKVAEVVSSLLQENIAAKLVKKMIERIIKVNIKPLSVIMRQKLKKNKEKRVLSYRFDQ